MFFQCLSLLLGYKLCQLKFFKEKELDQGPIDLESYIYSLSL